MNGELVYVWRKVKKNTTDARTALVTHRWSGPAIAVGKEKSNVFVSCCSRVTKVAPECLRKANAAEQMIWDITTKEIENALDEENLSRDLVYFLRQRSQTKRQNRRISKENSIPP